MLPSLQWLFTVSCLLQEKLALFLPSPRCPYSNSRRSNSGRFDQENDFLTTKLSKVLIFQNIVAIFVIVEWNMSIAEDFDFDVVWLQMLSGGEYKSVIGRAILKAEKEEKISMAFLCCPQKKKKKKNFGSSESRSVSLSQQAILALILPLVYNVIIFVFKKFNSWKAKYKSTPWIHQHLYTRSWVHKHWTLYTFFYHVCLFLSVHTFASTYFKTMKIEFPWLGLMGIINPLKFDIIVI